MTDNERAQEFAVEGVTASVYADLVDGDERFFLVWEGPLGRLVVPMPGGMTIAQASAVAKDAWEKGPVSE